MEDSGEFSSNSADQAVFFKNDELPVTSSPIEGKFIDNPSFNKQFVAEIPTWAALLENYHHRKKSQKVKIQPKLETNSHQASTVCSNGSNLSQMQPIAEHRMKVLVTPNRKIKVIASNGVNVRTERSPRKSYSKLNQAYRLRFEEPECEDESIDTIRKMLKSKEQLTLKDVERYEKIVHSCIDHRTNAKTPPDSIQSNAMQFIEKGIENLSLTPNSARILQTKWLQQEKRLVTLAISKRKSSAEIKQKIAHQKEIAKRQIKNYESAELKQLKASLLRKEARDMSNCFNKLQAAHFNQLVKNNQQKNYVCQLKKQVEIEKKKNESQASKIVKDVWDTLLQQQYGEMRNQVKQHKKMQQKMLMNVAENLQDSKKKYEEKYKMLKDIAQGKAAQSGLHEKEIKSEIYRIQRNLRCQFDIEFQALLSKIELKAERTRFLRAEKGEKLRERIEKADYVFDI